MLALLWVFVFSRSTLAQRVPFFAPNATAFTPEIGVVNTGIVSDVQATVSADQRYVTLGMRQQNSALLALREFKFQNGNPNNPFVGNVGGAGAAEAVAKAQAAAQASGKKASTARRAKSDSSDTDIPGARAALQPAPNARSTGPNPLDRVGMTRLD